MCPQQACTKASPISLCRDAAIRAKQALARDRDVKLEEEGKEKPTVVPAAPRRGDDEDLLELQPSAR
jgi:hypothetical protein